MSNFSSISAAIKNIVGAVQLGGQPAFNADSQFEFPANQFPHFPGFTVVPDNVDSRYSTVAQNTRNYAFRVNIYYTLDDESDTALQASWDMMRELVDAVMDALDKSIDLNNTADFILPVPGEWFVENTATGLALVAPIRVTASKDIFLY